jgi:hypothetical protein
MIMIVALPGRLPGATGPLRSGLTRNLVGAFASCSNPRRSE